MLNPYQKASEIELKSRVEQSSPHELINMLLQGARSHIATAQGHLQRKHVREKGEHITKAISIVEGLISCLNHEAGAGIATNLNQLYLYIQQLLLKANLNNDENLLTEATQLLAEIHAAWQKIDASEKNS